MRYAIASGVIGAAVGALATYALTRDEALPSPRGELVAPAATPAGDASLGIAADTAPTAARLALYRAAALASEDELRESIEENASLAPTASRRFALDALLGRYAELDPRAAADHAEELGLAPALQAAIFRAWAREDLDGAVRHLAGMDDRRAARAIALDLVSTLGGTDAAIARLLDALPDADPELFRADALSAAAETSPAEALRRALELDSAAAALAIDDIAETWAAADPRGALAAAARIGDRAHRAAFEAAVLREWARQDPDAVLEFLASAEGRSRMLSRELDSRLLAQIGRASPMRVLKMGDSLPQPFGLIAVHTALQALARTDPTSALAYLESASLPERAQYVQTVAAGYAMSDPDAALEWARSLEGRVPGVLAAALRGIAQSDPERALEIALAETEPARRGQAVQTVVASMPTADPVRLEAFGDRLLASLDGPPGAVATLAQIWTASDPDTALGWLLANSERVDATAFGVAAHAFARSDPDLAAFYTPQIPEPARREWVSAVAQGYAQSAPERGIEWVGQLRGQPGFEEAVLSIAGSAASAEPLAAAGLLEDFDPASPLYPQAAATVAAGWSVQDPAGAAAWARRLDTDRARAVATQAAVQQWAGRDPLAARAWVLGLAPGEGRDEALGAFLTASAFRETVDPVVLDAFSSDTARQQALVSVVMVMGSRDRAAAERIIETHLTDPEAHARAEAMLARTSDAARMFSRFPPGAGTVIDPNGPVQVTGAAPALRVVPGR